MMIRSVIDANNELILVSSTVGGNSNPKMTFLEINVEHTTMRSGSKNIIDINSCSTHVHGNLSAKNTTMLEQFLNHTKNTTMLEQFLNHTKNTTMLEQFLNHTKNTTMLEQFLNHTKNTTLSRQLQNLEKQ